MSNFDSEAQYLLSNEETIVSSEERRAEMVQIYNHAKKASVGTSIVCPCCNKRFEKKSYQQAFCCKKCKDRYWNFVDEKRRERANIFGSI